MEDGNIMGTAWKRYGKNMAIIWNLEMVWK